MIKGFSAPFNMTEKDDRIGKDDKSKKYKFTPKEDLNIIKQKVKDLKKQRALKKEIEREEKEKHYVKNRNMMKNLHHQLIRDKGGEPMESDVPPYVTHKNSQIYEVSHSQPTVKLSNVHKDRRSPQLGKGKLPNRFTIDSLSKLRYEDIAGSGPDGFNPADILDEDDSDSDDSVLKHYRINDAKHTMNNSVADMPMHRNIAPTQGKQNSMRKMQVDKSQEIHVSLVKPPQHRRREKHRSIANGQGNLSQKRLPQPKLKYNTNASSRKNLHQKSPGANRRGMTTDIEKSNKKKLGTERNRRLDLPKGVHRTAKKGDHGAYQSDGQNKRYPPHVTRTVKKNSSKINNPMVGKSKFTNPNKHINASTIQNKGQPMLNRRHNGNVSMELYDRANKIQDSTKRNQEQRLANILKLHDNNMKRGVGIAKKNRAL
jgi:hypothetical protein